MNLSIKNVPERLADQLRIRAKRNHRSLQGELLDILEQTIEQQYLSVQEAGERLKSLGIRTLDDSSEMIRRDRDAR